MREFALLLAVAVLVSSDMGGAGLLSETGEEQRASIEVTSTAFQAGERIPVKYTCDGDDVSPPLSWSSIPAGTKSLALICDDPDAPMGTWVHWVIYNLPATATGLPENVPPHPILKDGARQGMSDFKRIGYGGPCPPSGTHRYSFRVYAIDSKLELEPGVAKADILKGMEGHLLAEGSLMGRYGR